MEHYGYECGMPKKVNKVPREYDDPEGYAQEEEDLIYYCYDE